MKKIFLAAMLFLVHGVPSCSLAADPPVSLKGQSSAAKNAPAWNLEVPFNQSTKTGGINALIETGNLNIVANSGFEHSTFSTGWTSSGGTFQVSTGSNIGTGLKGADWDASAASQTITSTAVTIPAGWYNGNGAVYCSFKTSATDYVLQAYDGTNILGSSTISASTSFGIQYASFVFPSSGSISLRVVSASNATNIYFDDCYVGPNSFLSLIGNAVGFTQLNDQAGNGSTATKIPYYTNTTVSSPNGVYTFAMDSTNGTSFTFLQPAVVTAQISFYNSSVGEQLGFSVNGTVTTNIYSQTDAVRKCLSQNIVVSATGYATSATCTFTVAAGDIVRPNTSGGTCGDTNSCSMGLTAISLASQRVFNANATPWWIQAVVSGANPALSKTDTGGHVEITNSSLTLTPISGSQPVGTLCSSTNAAATPSTGATTCAAGSESLGVTFNIQDAGAYTVCVEMPVYHDQTSGNALAYSYLFKLAETGTANQTIASDKSGTQITSRGASSTPGPIDTQEVSMCRIFTFSTAGQKAVRLFGYNPGTTSADSAIILSDSFGGRNVIFTVMKGSYSQPMPIFVGGITSNSTNALRTESAYVTNAGSCAVSTQSSTWITSVSDPGVGQCGLVWGATTWSQAPWCTCTMVAGGGASICSLLGATTTTGVTVFSQSPSAGGTSADSPFYITCTGPR